MQSRSEESAESSCIQRQTVESTLVSGQPPGPVCWEAGPGDWRAEVGIWVKLQASRGRETGQRARASGLAKHHTQAEGHPELKGEGSLPALSWPQTRPRRSPLPTLLPAHPFCLLWPTPLGAGLVPARWTHFQGACSTPILPLKTTPRREHLAPVVLGCRSPDLCRFRLLTRVPSP